MSFLRLIYYSAMVGGWAAFVGWFLGEAALLHRSARPDTWKMVVTAALCGAMIGGGLNFLSGIVSGPLVKALPRLAVGLALGFVSGAIGSLFGNIFYGLLPEKLHLVGLMVGWTVMGTSIGVVEGLYDLNLRKLRNGMLGGTVGGIMGGLLFGLSTWVLGNPMSSRCVGLVVVGMFIGVSIGFAQVMLRDAWLTVEDGFRPGRQLMLSQRETFLGTSERANLIFIAFGAKGVEPLHVRIVRRGDGIYEARDNGSRTGSFVNEQQIADAVPLRNGDVIRFGVNKVRFNERYRAGAARALPSAVVPESRQPAPQPSVAVANAIRAALPAAPKPEAIQPARAAPATPVAVPKPPSAPPRPATKPAPVAPASVPAAPPAQPGRGECPICGTPAPAAAGRRRCENCGAMF